MIKRILYLAIVGLAACKQQPKLTDNSAPAWYKNEIIYNLDVKTFKDSDGNGIGDFRGLASKIAYLDSLGVTMLWLAPFQPSPLQDDGYDVTDYTAIDATLGSKTDFDNFIKEAKKHKLKVIVDVVLNHSSIRHPWFRQRPDWYVWTVKQPVDWDKGMGFPGVEKETWRKDSVTGNYFFHRFYHFQPDLNYQNPEVLAEGKRILTYWLKQGIDGFRLDAVPFIIDDPRISAETPKHHFKILHDLALAVRKVKPDAVLLGEANVKPDEVKDYFSKKGEALDMMLNFEVNEFLFYAMASGNAEPLKEALEATISKPPQDQWVYFLRNHDEIDLGKLSKSQIKTVYNQMGPDTNMQLYDRGIRRRLAPMLNNNMQRLRQAYALVLALPGTPALRYGEEVGMGDDLSLKERLAVRTPMQWDSTSHAGFSTAKNIFRPVINEGAYGYKTVSVLAQQKDSRSLLNYTRCLIQLRKVHPEIGQGKWDIHDAGNKNCLIIRYPSQNKTLMAVINFSAKQQKVNMPVTERSLKDLITGSKLTIDKDDKLILPAYAAYWVVAGNVD